MRTNAPVPPESSSPVLSIRTGLPVSVPPFWCQMSPSEMNVPLLAIVPPFWVMPRLWSPIVVTCSVAPLSTVIVPLLTRPFVVSVPLCTCSVPVFVSVPRP